MGAIAKQKNGDWYVFVTHKNERMAKKFANQGEAEAHAEAAQNAIDHGLYNLQAMKAPRPAAKEEAAKAGKSDSPTLRQFYEKTMTPIWEGSVAESTLARYETSFRTHVLPALGDIPINQIDRDRLKAFVAVLIKTPARKRARTEEGLKAEKVRRLSHDSVRLNLAALGAAMTEAVEMKLILVNPCGKLGKFYRETAKVRDEADPFTAKEVPVLLSAVLEHFGFEAYTLVLLALHTGLRASEIAGLKWSDVDFPERFIVVRRQHKDGKEKKRTKTGRVRKIDISDALLQELQALRKLRMETCLTAGQNTIPEWVFLSPGKKLPKGKRAVGEPVDMDNFRNRVFWIACDKAKLRRRRFHDTRHTFATLLIMAGESLAYVRDQCGHSSIQVTVDVYGHWIPGSNRQATNKLPSLSPLQSAAKTAGD